MECSLLCRRHSPRTWERRMEMQWWKIFIQAAEGWHAAERKPPHSVVTGGLLWQARGQLGLWSTGEGRVHVQWILIPKVKVSEIIVSRRKATDWQTRSRIREFHEGEEKWNRSQGLTVIITNEDQNQQGGASQETMCDAETRKEPGSLAACGEAGSLTLPRTSFNSYELRITMSL